jgi:hypothetical protein
MLLDDDDEIIAAIYGTYQLVTHIDKHCNRAEYRRSPLSGLQWVERKLANETVCYNMFRMSPTMFLWLHDLLTQQYGLKSTKKSTSIEALAIFLWMVGAPQSVRQAEDRFEISLGTMHNMFHRVLKCVLALSADIIRLRDPHFTTMHKRLENPRFYPFFKDCIGAIDVTYIPLVVPRDKFVQYLCRKDKTTQNVIVACDFDMIFTFVLAGWPGSVHDMRVFDAMTRYANDFPHPPRGTYLDVSS